MTARKNQDTVGAKPASKNYGTSSTGAMRESIGTKISTHLVPYELTLAAAVGLNYGEKKYAARNFERGLPATGLLGSIERHTKAIMDGEFLDGPSGLPHYCLLASSVAMFVHNTVNGKLVDDLPEPKFLVTGGLCVGDMAERFQQYLNDALCIHVPDFPE